MADDDDRPNWYRLALSRRTPKKLRRRAWKVILPIEIVGGILTIVAWKIVPDTWWTLLILLVLLAAILADLLYFSR
jgi:fatty acid desaturase